MTSRQILARAAGMIEKHGLAYEGAYKSGAWCIGAALVESSYEYVKGRQKFNDGMYTQARNVLCGQLGINSSYHALVDWNDDFRTDKSGKRTYKHTKADAVAALRHAMTIADDPKKVNTNSK